MKLRKELIFLLLVMAAASEPEVSEKRSDSLEEEAEEDVSLEETAFEHLQELKTLQDTFLSIVPATEPYLSNKVTKRKEEPENEAETSEESPVMRNMWMKAMIAQTKIIDLPNNNLRIEEEDTEAWSDEEQLEPISEETQEPLPPTQQEGIL